MVSGGRSTHQSELRPVCPLLIHREERRSLLGDDKESIIANVGGDSISRKIMAIEKGRRPNRRSHPFLVAEDRKYSARVAIRRVLDCVTLCLSLMACTGTLSTAPVEFTEGQFVGRPLSEMVAALGPPTTKSMLDDRNMAVEWVYYTQCSRSAMANSAKPNSPTLSDWTVVSWQQSEACTSAR